MAFCSKCGAQNADGAKFCGGCGAPLAPAAEQSAPTAQPAGQATPTAEPTWKAAPGGEPADQAAPTAQPPWADPSWQQAAPTAQPTWQSAPSGQQSAPTGQPTWQSAPSGGQYAPTGQQPWAGQGAYGMTKVKQPRGWLGLFGAILAFISMMAFSHINNDYGYSFTYMDFFKVSEMLGSEEAKSIIAVSFALVIAAAVLYVLSKNLAGLIVSIISLLLFYFVLSKLCEGGGVDLFSVVGIGFWLTVIGHIAMILSMPLKNVNEKINAAFGGNKK